MLNNFLDKIFELQEFLNGNGLNLSEDKMHIL